MSDILYDEVPSLDLADFMSGDPAKKKKFVADLGAAYNNIGFVAIKNHGLSAELQDRLYAAIKKYFSQPEEEKAKHEKPEIGFQRGYTGKGKEHAKGRNTGDLKEFYHVGQLLETIPDSDPIKAEYPENVWPAYPAEFEEISKEAYQTIEKAGKNMLRAIALYLELPEDYFEKKVEHGNSILRSIHYFPIEDPDSIPADAVRAAEHGDINLITLTHGSKC